MNLAQYLLILKNYIEQKTIKNKIKRGEILEEHEMDWTG